MSAQDTPTARALCTAPSRARAAWSTAAAAAWTRLERLGRLEMCLPHRSRELVDVVAVSDVDDGVRPFRNDPAGGQALLRRR